MIRSVMVPMQVQIDHRHLNSHLLLNPTLHPKLPLNAAIIPKSISTPRANFFYFLSKYYSKLPVHTNLTKLTGSMYA